MKKIYLIFSIAFFVLLSAITMFTVFVPDKPFSETENRKLAQKPELSMETIMDKSFQNTLGDYLSDQFPFRNAMISINTLSNKVLGVDNINGAYIGKNGFYFEVVVNDDIDFDRNLNNLKAINIFKNNNSNINVNVILAPTASDIYNDYMPQNAEIYDAEALYNVAQNTLNDGIYIDVRTPLIDAKEEYIYYKTDHHWTSRGAYIAYEEYCKVLNIEPKSYSDFDFEQICDSFFGSLHSKNLDIFAEPDKIFIANNINAEKAQTNDSEINIYDKTKLDVKDKYLVFFGDNYGQVTIETDNKNGKILLVVKDSFANSFVPLLTEHFEKIVMIDQRYYTGRSFSQLIKSNSITDVLFLYEVTNLSDQTKLATACKR